ncbi:MAG: hypothetical protein IPF68_08725 [Bacteroidales bacterium]|nr:hypothetical protein [Bacteroidales bacterium]
MVKKIIINFLLVSATVFVLDFAIGRTLRYYYFLEDSGIHYRTAFSINNTTAEFLILGSSRATHHYVPDVFEERTGMSFYNTGRQGTGIFHQLAVLTAVLKRYKPEVIILDYAGDFRLGDNTYARLSSLLPYYREHEELRWIVEQKSPWEKIKLLSEIYPFSSQVQQIILGNLKFNKIREQDDRGYVSLHSRWEADIDSVDNLPKFGLDSLKIEAFTKLIRMAKEAGAKVFIIRSPIFCKTTWNDDVEICIRQSKAQGVPFWDFSQDTLFLNHSYLFKDPGHLNHEGALIFSGIISDSIAPYLKR